ncbi:MAG TPA: CDP-alcohol phosphatidyltransferase family protein [Polyangiaceae bacterium]|nr:CDP-alcohol phosphatidyltransferase family protein [Polyangiaceae bacterium]
MTAWIPKLSQGNAYAKVRLRGTVWERVDLAHGAYSALTSVGGVIGRTGISPNAITWLSLLIAAVSGVAVLLGSFALGALLLVASGLCDALDGAVARATGRVSPFGALLDSTIDRLADALPLIGMMVFFASRPGLALIPAVAMLGAFVVPYVRARAEGLGVTLPPLFMRRPERLVLLVLSLLLGTLPITGPVPQILMLVGVGLMAVLSFYGAVSALRAAQVALEQPKRESMPPPSVRSRPITASGP